MADLLSLAQIIAGLGFSLWGDQNDMPRELSDLTDLQRNSAEAVVNPGDPNYTRLADSLLADSRSGLAEQLLGLRTALRRRSMTMGTGREGGGSMSPVSSRWDEALAATYGGAHGDAAETARSAAREYLHQVSGLGARGIAASAPALLASQFLNNRATLGAILGGGDLLNYGSNLGLSKLFAPSRPATINVVGRSR